MGSNPMGKPYLMSSVWASDSFEVVFVGVAEIKGMTKKMKMERRKR